MHVAFWATLYIYVTVNVSNQGTCIFPEIFREYTHSLIWHIHCNIYTHMRVYLHCGPKRDILFGSGTDPISLSILSFFLSFLLRRRSSKKPKATSFQIGLGYQQGRSGGGISVYIPSQNQARPGKFLWSKNHVLMVIDLIQYIVIPPKKFNNEFWKFISPKNF